MLNAILPASPVSASVSPMSDPLPIETTNPVLHRIARCASTDETEAFAADLAPHLAEGHVVLLQGQLGAGKTAFVRGLCRGLGMSDPWEVDSPTYTVVNHYKAGPGVDHLDLYRFSGAEELEEIGFDEIIASPSIVLIEWPERLADIPHSTMLWHVHLEIVEASVRRIRVRQLGA